MNDGAGGGGAAHLRRQLTRRAPVAAAFESVVGARDPLFIVFRTVNAYECANRRRSLTSTMGLLRQAAPVFSLWLPR